MVNKPRLDELSEELDALVEKMKDRKIGSIITKSAYLCIFKDKKEHDRIIANLKKLADRVK